MSILKRLGVIDNVISGLLGQDGPKIVPDAPTVEAPTVDEPAPEPEHDEPSLAGPWGKDRVGKFGATLAGQYGLRLSSHVRSPARNRAAGGAKRSDHLTGMAVDLAGKASKMEALYRWAKQNEGPGKLFRVVLYKYERADHSDHVHLSFNPEAKNVIAGMAEAAKAKGRPAKPVAKPDNVRARLAVVDRVLRGGDPGDLVDAFAGDDPLSRAGLTRGDLIPAAKATPDKDRLSVDDLYAVARRAGFSRDEAVMMTAIGMGESKGRPRAHNPVGRDNSYGLWQINMLGRMGADRRRSFGIASNEELWDPAVNARAAMAVYKAQGFRAWSVFTNGTYRKYLDAARAAANRVDA